MELGKLDMDEGNYSFTVSCLVLGGRLRCIILKFLMTFSKIFSPGYFLVGQVKMESLFLLNGMKVKEPLREHTIDSEKNLLELCSLTQPKIAFWLQVKMAKLSFGTWTTLIF